MELVSNKETTVAVLPFRILGVVENISSVIVEFTDDFVVLDGCCGTDVSHIDTICSNLLKKSVHE